MSTFKVKGGAEIVHVEGDNWLVALGASLPHFGLASTSLSRLAVDVAASGIVSVRDPVSGRRFELAPVATEPSAAPRPVSVTLDPERPTPRRAPAPVGGPAPILPPMSFGVPLILPTSAPAKARVTPGVAVAAAAKPGPPAPSPTPTWPTSVPEDSLPPLSATPALTPRLAPPPVLATPPPAPEPAPLPPPRATTEVQLPPSAVETQVLPASAAPPPPLTMNPNARPDLASLPRPSAPPTPVPAAPPRIPVSAVAEADRPADLVEELFDRCFELSFEPDIGGACRKALEILAELVPAEAGAVLYGGLAHRELSFVAAYGPAAGALRGRTLPMDTGIAGFVHQRGMNLVINDAGADARHDKSVDQASGYVTDRILAAVVQDEHGTTFGCIELLNPPGDFRDWHLEAAMVVAGSLAQYVGSRQEI